MTPFAYHRATSAADARAAMRPGACYLAGGTSLIDLMKTGVEAPDLLVDLNRGAGMGGLEWLPDGTLRAGAAVRMTALARDPQVARRFPVLHQALLAGATPQLRNMASLAGNLLQRTRCFYFRDPSFAACNKRAPGTGCAARHGVNAEQAILGWTEACVAVHPSDLAVALLALDVRVVTDRRTLPMETLHCGPGDDPRADTVLEEGELILALEVLPGPRAAGSAYAKAPAGGFALASAAVAIEMRDGRILSARIALGGVAHRPWRSQEAEAVLAGSADGAPSFTAAADAALSGARPLSGNGFKLPLARAVLIEALSAAAGVAA